MSHAPQHQGPGRSDGCSGDQTSSPGWTRKTLMFVQWIGLRENWNRKAPYLMVKTHGFPVDFPLNQSIDLWVNHCLSYEQ